MCVDYSTGSSKAKCCHLRAVVHKQLEGHKISHNPGVGQDDLKRVIMYTILN